MPFLFNQLPGTVNSRVELTKQQITAEDRSMAAILADYWTNFAKTGDPNGESLPRWPIYNVEDDIWMDLGVKPAPLPGFRARDMDFWESRFLKFLQPD